MILDTTLMSLKLTLTAAKTANDMDVTVDFMDWDTKNEMTAPATQRTASNGVADVTILTAPNANPRREPVRVTVYNKDTAAKNVIIKTDDGTTQFIEIQSALASLKSLIWEKNNGWYVTA